MTTPIRTVAEVLDHGVSAFEMAIGCEVFGIDRSSDGLPSFDFAVCGVRPGPLRTTSGFSILPDYDLEPLEAADLILVPPLASDYEPGPELVGLLRRAVDRGATIASMCSGAFVLARAGLLEGRRATTHWFHTAQFRTEFPSIELVPDVLYVVDGPIATSAGTAAGVDLCLHLVRHSHGVQAANGIARRMVVPPHRDGGQAQYIETPVRPAEAPTLAPVMDWVVERLDDDVTVECMADHASMSVRTFARRFRDETGTTPHHWLLAQRVALAERLLESSDASMEEVARRSGFGSATMLRHHFMRLRGTSPTTYRRMFCGREPRAAAG